MIAFCIITLSYFKGLEYFYKMNDYIAPVMTISIIVMVFLYLCSLDVIANRLGMTNIEYKYLSIEKSVTGALPIEICKNGKNCDASKTHYDENGTDGVIKLHNIKAISTLGKFYYLETKDGTKFELDASKIISRKKIRKANLSYQDILDEKDESVKNAKKICKFLKGKFFKLRDKKQQTSAFDRSFKRRK